MFYAWIGFMAGLMVGVAVIARREGRRLHQQAASARDQREQEQAALVGTIASGMAHEIRNPLSTLRMNLQLLREDWENPITEREQKGRRRIDVLLRETERMESVVADFVRFDGVFEALRDPARFAEVRVDPDLGTICWPNGADLAPEVLYARLTGTRLSV